MKQPSSLDTPHFIDLLLDQIQAKVLQQSYENDLAKQIPIFSTVYLADITTRIIHNFVDDGEGRFSKQQIDPEPKALIQDNLMPSSINSVQPPVLMTQPPKAEPSVGSTRKRISSLVTNLQQSQEVPKKKSIPQGQISENLIPLKMEEQEEDRIVKFLREKKQTEDKEQSINKESAKKPTRKQKEKKPVAVTYDFNGQVIQVKGSPATNLVRNGLQAVIDSNIQLNSFKDFNPLEKVQLNINKPKDQPVKKKKWAQNTEEQDKEPEEEVPIQPLSSIPIQTFEVCEGARITTISGQLNERGKRDLSTKQLLQNYKKIKLSKSQYQKIRQFQARQQSIQKQKFNIKPTSIEKSQNKIEKEKKRSNSVIDLKHTKHRGQKVLVNNQELRDTYLKYPVEDEGSTSILNATQQKQNLTQFSSNPRDEQVQFLMKKQINPGMNRTRTVLVLPQIKNKLTIVNALPKARERVKNQKQLLGQFHKKFQDRLRLTSIKN